MDYYKSEEVSLMIVTLTLPPDVERAFLAEAEARGLSLDEFISDVIRSRVSGPQSSPPSVQSGNAAAQSFQLEQEYGVPVRRTGQPIEPSVIDDTLDLIRREREIALPIRPARLSPEEWAREFDEWADSFPEAPPIPDEALSRENLYPDRW
jgi:hypothetical protein